jgi:putative spermidine/putrescine transport system substrate-binding protein
VIPGEGTFSMPLVMGLVRGAPHAEEARKYLDWLLTPEAQAEFSRGFFRPVLSGSMPPDVASKFLPASDYERARNLDLAKMAGAADALKKAWLEEIRQSH